MLNILSNLIRENSLCTFSQKYVQYIYRMAKKKGKGSGFDIFKEME